MKERQHVLSEYRLGTVSIVSKYGLDWWAVRFPVLLFLVFWRKKGKENHQKNKDFIPTEPLKSLEKKGQTLKKNKEFIATEKKKTRNSPKKKTRKGRTGFGSVPRTVALLS